MGDDELDHSVSVAAVCRKWPLTVCCFVFLLDFGIEATRGS